MTKAGFEPRHHLEPISTRPHSTRLKNKTKKQSLPGSPATYVHSAWVGKATYASFPNSVPFKSRSVFPRVEFAHAKGLRRRGGDTGGEAEDLSVDPAAGFTQGSVREATDTSQSHLLAVDTQD